MRPEDEAWDKAMRDLGKMLANAALGLMPGDAQGKELAEQMLDAAIEKERAKLRASKENK